MTSPSKQVRIRGVYLGGHPDHSRPGTAALQLDALGVSVTAVKTFIRLPWTQVTALVAEGPDQVQTRFTVTRLALMGPFGLAFKQKKKIGYIVVQGTFGEFIFAVKGSTPVELRAKIAPWATHASLAPPPAEPAPPVGLPGVDRIGQLRELADLRDRGALTDEEFANEKARLLAAPGERVAQIENTGASVERQNFGGTEDQAKITGPERTSSSRIYPVPQERLLEAVRRAITECGYTPTGENVEAGVISFTTGVSVRTWGMTMAAAVVALGDASSRIDLDGNRKVGKTQALTWGETNKVARNIYACLDRILVPPDAASGLPASELPEVPPGAASPPPETPRKAFPSS